MDIQSYEYNLENSLAKKSLLEKQNQETCTTEYSPKEVPDVSANHLPNANDASQETCKFPRRKSFSYAGD
jgi:hypothetical protein